VIGFVAGCCVSNIIVHPAFLSAFNICNFLFWMFGGNYVFVVNVYIYIVEISFS